MTRDDVGEVVREVLSHVLKKRITKDEGVHRKDASSWDSLKHVELIFILEERFGVSFDEEMAELDSLKKIVDGVWKRYEA